MRRIFGRMFLLIPAAGMLLVPLSATADTAYGDQDSNLSVSQTITITASVAPAREAIVNSAGQLTEIYSNTMQNVVPTTYIGSLSGPQQVMTPDVERQYDQVIATTKQLVGVKIPVASASTPATNSGSRSLLTTLFGSVSSMLRPAW